MPLDINRLSGVEVDEPSTFDDPNWTNPGRSPGEKSFFERKRQQYFYQKGLTPPALPIPMRDAEPEPLAALAPGKPANEHQRGARLRGRKRQAPIFGEAPRAFVSKGMRRRIMHAAEAFERRTKKKGKKNGLLGATGVNVLRVLLFTFHSAQGQTYPSYNALQEATGHCRQTIAECIERLERHGFLKVINRIKREAGKVFSGLHGRMIEIVRVVQTSNAYTMHLPAELDESEAEDAPERPFPPRRIVNPGPGVMAWQQIQALLPNLGFRTESGS